MRTLAAALVLSLAVAAPARAERMKLAVLPTQFDKSSEGLVPKLFDEYVLAAVQNAGDYEVIGQDDIAAMVGFEKQKDMLGCDDASCIANIGGALGVDRVIAIRIARLDPDWVVTSKLINIKLTKVEARTSDMVVGNVKALLNAVPDIVGKLFETAQGKGGGMASVSGSAAPGKGPAAATAPRAGRTSATSAPAADTAFVPGDSHGRVARTVGQILTWSGVGCAAISLVYGYAASEALATPTWNPTTGNYDTTASEPTGVQAGSIVGGGCLLLTAIGSGLYLNGKARAATGDDDASGHVGYRWLGWVLVAAGAVGPFMVSETDQALLVGGVGLGGAALVFGLSMASNGGYATSRGEERPFASLTVLQGVDREGSPHAVPALALVSSF